VANLLRSVSTVMAGPKNATPWVWRFSLEDGDLRPLETEGLGLGADCVARDLLGTLIRSTVGGVETQGVVVETEAYLGPQDPASHAAERIGRTRRNQSMFGSPGHAYVYRIYGVHWCLNVVTGDPGFPAAVLIRGVDPVKGVDEMLRRRKGRKPLGAGPGRLAQALGVTGELDGHPLDRPPLQLLNGWRVQDAAVGVSGRVGVRHAPDWPLRFYLRDHPEVSRGPRG